MAFNTPCWRDPPCGLIGWGEGGTCLFCWEASVLESIGLYLRGGAGWKEGRGEASLCCLVGTSLAILVLGADWGFASWVCCFTCSWRIGWVDLLFLSFPASGWGLMYFWNNSGNKTNNICYGCHIFSTNSIRHCPKQLTWSVSFIPFDFEGRYFYFLQFVTQGEVSPCSQSQSCGSPTYTQPLCQNHYVICPSAFHFPNINLCVSPFSLSLKTEAFLFS